MWSHAPPEHISPFHQEKRAGHLPRCSKWRGERGPNPETWQSSENTSLHGAEGMRTGGCNPGQETIVVDGRVEEF